MGGILEQLELDHTFFIQFVIIFVLFMILANLYFKPFMKLFQARHKRVVEDREAAEGLVKQADAKFEEYKKRLADERAIARKDYEELLKSARVEEAQILTEARNQAKKITQEAVDSANQQRERLKQTLEADVESIANQISEKLLVRND